MAAEIRLAVVAETLLPSKHFRTYFAIHIATYVINTGVCSCDGKATELEADLAPNCSAEGRNGDMYTSTLE